MIRDITIGQYYPANSKLHRLDPRVKIVCTMIFLISLFCFQNIWGYVIATVFLASIIRISKVPFKFIVTCIRFIYFHVCVSSPLVSGFTFYSCTSTCTMLGHSKTQEILLNE